MSSTLQQKMSKTILNLQNQSSFHQLSGFTTHQLFLSHRELSRCFPKTILHKSQIRVILFCDPLLLEEWYSRTVPKWSNSHSPLPQDRQVVIHRFSWPCVSLSASDDLNGGPKAHRAFTLGICDMERKTQFFQGQHPERLKLNLELAPDGQPSKTELSLVRGKRLSRSWCSKEENAHTASRAATQQVRKTTPSKSRAPSRTSVLTGLLEPFVIQTARCLLQLSTTDRLLIVNHVRFLLGCHSGQTLDNHLQEFAQDAQYATWDMRETGVPSNPTSSGASRSSVPHASAPHFRFNHPREGALSPSCLCRGLQRTDATHWVALCGRSGDTGDRRTAPEFATHTANPAPNRWPLTDDPSPTFRCCRESWENLPLELHGFSINSIQFAEVIGFWPPLNLFLPRLNRIVSYFPEHNTESE